MRLKRFSPYVRTYIVHTDAHVRLRPAISLGKFSPLPVGIIMGKHTSGSETFGVIQRDFTWKILSPPPSRPRVQLPSLEGRGVGGGVGKPLSRFSDTPTRSSARPVCIYTYTHTIYIYRYNFILYILYIHICIYRANLVFVFALLSSEEFSTLSLERTGGGLAFLHLV